MPTDLDRAPVAWRIAVFTNMPGGFFFSLVQEAARTMGHRVVGVLTTPGPRSRRSATYLEVVAAVPPGIDVLVSNHPGRWAATVASWQPDLIVSGGFPWRIPAEVLDAARYGGVNVHDALLPRHRGPNATGWAFRLGDRETGVTIHRLAPEFDTGAILAQHRVPIEDHDTWDTLLPQFTQALPALLRRAIDRIARGDPEDPQDESLATEAGIFPPEWRIIAWSRPARSIHDQVRSWVGLRDIPAGALGELDGQVMQIVRTRLLPDSPNGAKATPGTILERSQDHLVVQCGDGPLEIREWHPVNGES